MSIITSENMIGHFRIAINKHEKKDLQSFIERYEKKYLMDLFGPSLYDAFISDLGGASPQTPNTAPFTTIFTCFQICTPCGRIYNADGLLDMLKGFFYFHWNAENWLKKTSSGTTVVDSENSTPADAAIHSIVDEIWF